MKIQPTHYGQTHVSIFPNEVDELILAEEFGLNIEARKNGRGELTHYYKFIPTVQAHAFKTFVKENT